MENDGLQKQVESPSMDPVLAALKKRIGFLQGMYLVLFMASLGMLLVNMTAHRPLAFHVVWAVCLGAAVVTRIYRQSQVAKYNSLLMGGRPTPLV
jgi:hypothetical protein